MAQVRQENEEYQAGQIACYADYGFKAVGTMAGTVVLMDLPQDPATTKLADQAAAACNAKVPLPEHMDSKALNDAAYQRMLDLRACIIAHGYAIPAAPSEATWEDSSPWYSAWNPYSVFVGPSATLSLSSDELLALSDACPQPGPNYVAETSAES